MPTPHGTNTGISENKGVNDFLGAVYPNPVTNSFQFDLQLDRNAFVNVLLTDLEGRTLKTLYIGKMIPGIHKITTDVIGLSSGFYLVKVQLRDRELTRKILILNSKK
jgi:alpha-amylase